MADLNVKFLKGSLDSLEKMTTSVAGAFYLTEDVPRLYYGTGSGAPVALNEQITVVDSIANLPSPARAKDLLYYAKQENILCISKTDKSGWIQINPDTDTNTSIHSFTVSEPKQNGDNWVYDLKIVEKNKDGDITDEKGNPIGEFTAQLTVTPDMIADLAVNVSVGVGATLSGNTATVKLNGVGANQGEVVTITGGSNVTIGGTEDAITVTAKDTTYELQTQLDATNETVKVHLYDKYDSEIADTVSIKAGNKLDIALANDVVTLNHETSTVSEGAYAASSAASGTNGTKISIPGFEVDAYGHVVEAGTTDVTIVDTTYTVNAVGANNAGKITVAIKDHDDNVSTLTSGEDLFYNITVDGTAQKVLNQGDLGSFYSASEIDKKIKGLDAFSYKGTVGTGGTVATLPTTKVAIGDTYKTTANGVYKINGVDTTLHAGDIIIANSTSGKEESDGYIATANINWDVIHSENNTDTTYTLTATGNQIILEDSETNKNTLTLADDDEVILSTPAANQIKAEHKKHNASGTFGGNGGNVGFKGTVVVPQLTVNEYGHVTAIADKTYTLPAENTYKFVGNEANDAIYLNDKDGRVGELIFTDDEWIAADLTASTQGGTLAITHKDVTRKDVSANQGVGFKQTITAISEVVSDDKGHITDVKTTTYTLPDETVYTLSGATIVAKTSGNANGVTITDTLTGKDNAQTTSAFSLVSETLKITNTDNVVKAELLWGTF